MRDVETSNPRLTLGWAFYSNILEKTKPQVIADLERYGFVDALKCENSNDLISWYSTMGKKTGVEYALYIIDFATCSGYAPGLTKEEQYKNAYHWVGEKKVRGYPGKEELWLSDTRTLVKELVTKLMGDQKIKFSALDYSRTPSLWGTSGAVVYDKKRRLVGNVDGINYVAKDTKWAEAALIPPEEVYKAMFTKKRQYAKIIEKRETKKTRLVIGSNLEQYWVQDYLSESLLDDIFRGSDLSTLWMTPRQTAEFWDDFRTTEYGYNMPLDQSEFDQNQSAAHIKAILQGVLDGVRPIVTEEWVELFENAMYSMGGGYVQTSSGKISYKSGILSGWRWTAWLDTLINYVTFTLACREELITPIRKLFQGDDVRSRFTTIGEAARVRARIESYGYIVNPRKFFVSALRDEYLRRTAIEGRVQGYPARSVNALLWSSPLAADPAPGIDRLSEMLTSWEILKGRLQIYESKFLTSVMVGEMSRANELTRKDVHKWLETDAAWGGGSLLPTSYTVTVSKSEPEHEVRIGLVPGILSETDQCNKYAFPLKYSEAAKEWARRMKWRKETYTRAKTQNVRLAPPIPLQPGSTPDPPELPFWTNFFAQSYTAHFEDIPQYWWHGASDAVRKDTYLGRPLFSIPSRLGVDTTWLRMKIDKYYSYAIGTLYGLRTRTSNEIRRIQSSLNMIISKQINSFLSQSVIV